MSDHHEGGDGAVGSDSVAEVDSFFVADRDVGWLPGSASLAATQMSAGTFVGTIGIHYAVGISFIAIWPVIWLGWLVSMLYIAPNLRAFGGVTVPEYVAARFSRDGAEGRRIQAVTAVLIAAIYLVYTAAQYIAGGVVVETVLGVPRVCGMSAIAVLVLCYTATGGMQASIVSDAVQVALMVGALLVAVAVSLGAVGGVGSLYRQAEAIDPSLFGVGMAPVDTLGLALAFALGMAVAPYEVSRVYAMESPETVQRAIKGSIAIQAVVAVCVATLGLVARVSYPALATPDAAVARLAEGLLGTVGGGVLLVGVLAAVLSTIDSVLLVSASAIAYDLYGAVLRPADDHWLHSILGSDDVMTVARLTTVAAALGPLAFAVRPALLGGFVQFVVALYAALVAGTLFAPVVLGLHWDSATTGGAVAGILSGFVAVVCWHYLTVVMAAVTAPLSSVPPVVAGVLVSTVAVVAVSALPDVNRREQTTSGN